MTPYIALLALVVLVAYLGRRAGRTSGRLLGAAAACLLLILYAGLRDYRVGTDTGNYVYLFSHIDLLNVDSPLPTHTEIGYAVLNWIARSTSESYASLLLFIATVVVVLYVSTIVRLVKRYEVGVYLFVTLGSYTFLFNGARQAIAAAICFWALRFVLDRRLVFYALAVAIAMLFHKTAIAALPIYFLATPRFRLSRAVGLLIMALVFAAFAGELAGLATELLDDRFASYTVAGEGGGAVLTSFLIAQGLLLTWLRQFVRHDRDVYTRLLNVYLLSFVPAIVSVASGTNPSGLLRLHVYFSGVAILMWPMVFDAIHAARQTRAIAFAFVIVTMAFFLMTTMTFSDLTPYRLHTEYS
jgi:hypothetical protein